jgi:hypothetical protein
LDLFPVLTCENREIQEAVMSAGEEPLQDDAVAIVLDPTA